MIDYFIVSHDKNHIEKILKNKEIFFKKFKFLYVGNKKIKKSGRVVVCSKLKNNIEKFPYLCSYTAWYSVANNKINKNEYVCLLEHDVLFAKNFLEKNMASLDRNSVISYSQTFLNHRVFLKSTPWLELSLKKIYNIDLYKFTDHYKDVFPFWSTTTNKTLHIEVLKKFVDWYEPMTILFREYPLGAYVHERAFFVFCVLNNIKIKQLDKVLIHKQSSSHKIKDVYGKFLENKNTTELTESMQKEYDIIYNKELYNSKLLLD